MANAHEFSYPRSGFRISVPEPVVGPSCVIYPETETKPEACGAFDLQDLRARATPRGERKMVFAVASREGGATTLAMVHWTEGGYVDDDALLQVGSRMVTEIQSVAPPGFHVEATPASLTQANGARAVTLDVTARPETSNGQEMLLRHFFIPADSGMFYCGFLVIPPTDRAAFDGLVTKTMSTVRVVQPSPPPAKPKYDESDAEIRLGENIGKGILCAFAAAFIVLWIRQKVKS
ncbi:MAG: hypothetical protein HOW73_31655 [Polyangiaceae bacterium]|nr:hypothetical protein [Polyangiaceae bacterium]